MLEVDVSNQQDLAVVRLNGELDISTVEEFKQSVEKAKNSVSHMQLDLDKLSFVDSTGVGAILKVIKGLKQSNIEVKISNISAEVFEVFDLLGLPMLLGEELFECRG